MIVDFDDAPVSGQIERLLLLLAGVFIGINFIALTLIRPEGWETNLLAWGAWVACAISGHRLLNRYTPQRDQFLYPVVMLLSGWGIVIIDRLAPNFANRQAIWLVVATAVMLLIVALPTLIRWLNNYRYLWLLAGMGMLISSILFGSHPSGQIGAPQLWLNIGSIYFQPSEPLKIILVVFLASYLAEQYPLWRTEALQSTNRMLAFSPRFLGPTLLMWGLSIIILIWQRDLGTAALFFIVFLILLYIASGHPLILVSGGILLLLAGITAYGLFDVVRLRVDIWLNPWPEADGRAYQIVQSLQAFAAGGIFGQGIGQGLPDFIPVVHSDFIFAALAEEWGLLGVLTVIMSIGLIVVRGVRIAILQQGHPFRGLFAIGLSLLIAVQSIMIMGGVIRLLPLTGVTLPYMSYGGSSLLVSFIILAFLLRLSSDGKSG